MLKDTPPIFGLESGTMGVVGIAIWDSSAGTNAGITASLTVKGIVRDVQFISSPGQFRIFFNPSQNSPQSTNPTLASSLLYTVVCFCSGDLTVNSSGDLPGKLSALAASVDIQFRSTSGNVLRNPAVCNVTILGRVPPM